MTVLWGRRIHRVQSLTGDVKFLVKEFTGPWTRVPGVELHVFLRLRVSTMSSRKLTGTNYVPRP